jgi:hypothetical protein
MNMHPKRETLEQAGYTVHMRSGRDGYVLKDEADKLELWQVNNGHASYGIVLDNGNELEFVRSAP